MATTASTRAAATKPVKDHTGLSCVTVSYSVAANPTANDYVQLVPIPKGARIVDVIVTATDMDASTGMSFTIGDQQTTADDDRYITASAIGQTGGVARMNTQTGHLFQFTTDGTIDVKWAAAASGAFTAGTLTCTVLYTTDAAA